METRIHCIHFQPKTRIQRRSLSLDEIEYLDKNYWTTICDLVLSDDLTDSLDIRLVRLNIGCIGRPPKSWSVCTPSWKASASRFSVDVRTSDKLSTKIICERKPHVPWTCDHIEPCLLSSIKERLQVTEALERYISAFWFEKTPVDVDRSCIEAHRSS